ncbi:MAG: Fn3-like domain-containing protein, partial [Bacillota bacterium]|nr:Fn3-like domain-containing protein [Bacillota bacterium]
VGGLLTEYDPGSDFYSEDTTYDIKIGDLKFSKNRITVPANGTASVNVTISVPYNVKAEQFIEGFVKFTSSDKNVPSLVSPFIGFYGDWSKQDIIDKPVWDANCIWGESTLLTEMDGAYYYLGQTGTDKNGYPVINPDKIAISPNGNELNENVTPVFTFFRNAKEMKVQVLDKDENLISQVALDNDIRKNMIGQDEGYQLNDNWTWNGMVYNTDEGIYKALPEGQYYINYVTKVDIENAAEQDYKVPVKIDVTAPEIKITSGNTSNEKNYVLEWTGSDNLSGIAYTTIELNKEEVKNPVITENGGKYSCSLPLNPNKANTIVLKTLDYAYNETDAQIEVSDKTAVPFSITFDNLSSGLLINKSAITVTGKVSYKPDVLKIYGVDAVVKDDLTFSADITLKEYVNYVSVLAQDSEGNNLANYAIKVYCDTIAPVINIDSPAVSEDGRAYINTDTFTLKGTVSDNTLGYNFYVNGEQKLSVELSGVQGETNSRTFSYELPAVNNTYIELKAVDLFGNETIKTINIIVDKGKPVTKGRGNLR